jgi:acyl-CoA dehydrogenase
MIEFALSGRQREMKSVIHQFAKTIVRPESPRWDREHGIPHDFLSRIAAMAQAMGGSFARAPGSEDDGGAAELDAERRAKRAPAMTAVIGAEEMAWGDAALLMSLPGVGLGGPPVRASGTPEQKARFFSVFADMSQELRWAAYALTEPGAGSDVAAIRTSCRKDGRHWVLDGRKCFITNGARASWSVVFATVDPALGRAGHRAFVVEKGTPGFSVGKIEDKMGLRASETAELVFEECRVPEENLLGGEASYETSAGRNAGFMTAMKTFDTTRPMVAAMAIGIGRAAYEQATEFVRDHYVLSRPIPRYAAIAERLARVGRQLEAARLTTWRAAWLADRGEPNAKEASMCKAMAGGAALRACIEAIEICGAAGAVAEGGTEGSLLEKWFRDIKVFDIFEGTGQIQRIVVAKRLLPSLKSF